MLNGSMLRFSLQIETFNKKTVGFTCGKKNNVYAEGSMIGAVGVAN